jgi:hypothetical protein
MNEERTGKFLRQVEHIRGHLWHRYFITVNQVIHGGDSIACLTRDEIFDTFYDYHMRIIAIYSNCHFWMIYINNIWGILLFVLLDGYLMVYQYG